MQYLECVRPPSIHRDSFEFALFFPFIAGGTETGFLSAPCRMGGLSLFPSLGTYVSGADSRRFNPKLFAKTLRIIESE